VIDAIRVSLSTGIGTALVRARARLGRAMRTPRGFTMLEIAVVLFIIGLIISVIIPRFAGIRSAHLKSEARRLAGRATYLYSRAMSDKVVLRLSFDIDTDSYSVSRLDPYAAKPIFAPDTEPGFRPVMLPVGVRLRDVIVEGTGAMTRGTANCFFYPEGYVDATFVHLVDDSGTVFTLNFNPLTGRVSIRDGDIGPSPGMILR
jgi:general secretion pathway protein H